MRDVNLPVVTVIAILALLAGYCSERARALYMQSLWVVDTRDQLARDRVSSLAQRAGWYERQVNEHERRIDELTAALGELQKQRHFCARPSMSSISIPCYTLTTSIPVGR